MTYEIRRTAWGEREVAAGVADQEAFNQRYLEGRAVAVDPIDLPLSPTIISDRPEENDEVDRYGPLTPGEEAYLGRAVVVIEGPATLTDGEETGVVPGYWIVRRKNRRRQMVARHLLTTVAARKQAEVERLERERATAQRRDDAERLAVELRGRVEALGLAAFFRVDTQHSFGRGGEDWSVRCTTTGGAFSSGHAIDLIERLEALENGHITSPAEALVVEEEI